MHRKQPILSGGALLLSLFLISTTFLISTIPVTAQETSTVFRYDSPSVTTIASSFQVPVHQSASAASVRLLAPQIEIAPLSGVSGYPIGIFGADFGSSQGTVTILGQEATILEWTSTFVRAEIPAVSDGTGNITVTTVDNQSFSQPFEVYTINPNFQRAPTNRFTNIMRGKPAVVQNIDNNFCYQQPSGVYKEPTEFLTNFDCGFQGIIGDGEVVVTIPGGSSTVVAVDLEQALSGDYYFQFYGYPSWYANWDIGPKTYTIQVSADSTDGVDGGWVTVHTENDNSRGIRLHKINIPDGGYRWIRMNISVGSKEPRVKLKELRLYESSNSASSDLDMVAIYGDSITEGAFYHIGATGLSLQMSSKIGSADEPIFTPFGLSGQNSTGLIEQSNIDYDIFDTFATDNVGNMARYWGIALGNNDTGFADNDLGVPGTNLEEFDERVEAMVQLMISQNKVPILARLPDTNENTGTDVLATKKKLIGDIDRIAADYRLIPGPDLYTLMRLNIERDNASWYWPGDAYHQNWEGRVRIIDAWAEAIVRGTNRTPVDPEVPFTPTPTPTDAAPPTNTPIPTATSTPLPTATNTPEPTATNTPEPTATNTPEPTATATSTAIPSTPTPTALPGTPIPTVTASPLATGDPTPTLSVTPAQPSSPTAQPTSLSPGGESGESSGSTTYLPIIGQ